MRRYISPDEYDELYEKLPEEVGFVLYGDTLPLCAAALQKNFGVYVDKLAPINTLIIDTLLGLCPASEFKSELLKIGIDSEKAEKITTFIDTEVFAQIQDYLVDQYAEKNEEATYSYDEEEIDPYRESVPIIPGRGPIIESEHLEPNKEHILDEMFASHAPKIKELTPEDGAIVRPLDETPEHKDLFKEEAELPPETVIETPTEQSNFREKMLSRRKMQTSDTFVGKEEFEATVEANAKPEINTTIPVTPKKIVLEVSKTPKDTNETSANKKPAIISLIVSKKSQAVTTTTQTETKNPDKTEYTLDPYREDL